MFFPDILINSPLFGIALTIVAYSFSEFLISRFEINGLPPLIPSTLMCMAVLLLHPNITYDQYFNGAVFIHFLLGPATIALALPLIENIKTLKENLSIIVSGIIVATLAGVTSIYVCSKIFGASPDVLLSLIPKSVTTPIAMEISAAIGGIPALTVACVIFTGMLGASINHKVLALFGIKNDIAIGLAIGASSHGLGTSACANKSPLQLAIAGVSIALTGISTSIIAPLLLPILEKIMP